MSLAVDAIRSRPYSGSRIATVQALGDTSYRSLIVRYHSDGLIVRALLSTPLGLVPAGGWPVIILAHGYVDPAAYQTNGPDYRGIIATLVRAGYAVIKPDYRGHGQSQGSSEDGHFSPVYTYDILNLIVSIKQDARFNAQRIGLLGHSLGGHIALRTIVASPSIKATVIMAGVVGSFDDMFYHWANSSVPSGSPDVVQDTRESLVAHYGTPRDNPDFWSRASAINYVSNITGAVQIHHDENDSVVPKLFSDHLVRALQRAGKSVEYHVYPGDDHQFSQNRPALLQNMLSFYRHNL